MKSVTNQKEYVDELYLKLLQRNKRPDRLIKVMAFPPDSTLKAH